MLQPSYSFERDLKREEEAIRLRILANSDERNDQLIKLKVRDEVNVSIRHLLLDVTELSEARKIIRENLPKIENAVRSTLEHEGSDDSFTVHYEKRAPFPEKTYGATVYPAGEYEAVIIVIGKGEGENWWCVLFPNVCLLDFSQSSSMATREEIDNNQQTSETEEEEVEVKFFLFDWLGLS